MQPVLSIRGLSKSYKGGLQALKTVDLDIQRGEIFALLGPNGAGKTTLINAVCGIVTPTTGQITAAGYDTRKDYRAARSLIGLVPQEMHIDIFETVWAVTSYSRGLFGLPPNPAYIEQILRDLSLWEKKDEKLQALSGGMKRRVLIAKALAHEPEILFLDEPTAGVDIEVRRSMWEFLREINEAGTTIILTTHYLEEAESLCRNIAIIDKGRIAMHDRMQDVLRRLHSETFVLNLRTPLSGAVPVLPVASAELVDPTTLEVELTQHQDLNAVFAALTAADVHVVSMRNKVNRLEELFMRLIGQEETTGSAA